MNNNKPEAKFGTHVHVWKNTNERGEITRTVSISPRRYQKDGEWHDAAGWNVSDVAHLAHCLTMALNYCLVQRNNEPQPPTS